MFETHDLLLDVKDNVLAISYTDTGYNMQLSSTDLLSCHRVNQIFMCDSFGVMSRLIVHAGVRRHPDPVPL
jgi:hypothetical protein